MRPIIFIKMKKFTQVTLISISIVLFLAWMDVQGFLMWQAMGDLAAEAYVKAEPHYMMFFWTFAYALIGIVAAVYYVFRKDKSETVALVLTPLMLLWGGVEDIFYFIIQRKPIPETMPWLYDNVGVGNVSKLMGETTVTPQTLIASIIIFSGLAYLTHKYLKKSKW